MRLKDLLFLALVALAGAAISCNGSKGARDAAPTDGMTDTNRMDGAGADAADARDAADAGPDAADASDARADAADAGPGADGGDAADAGADASDQGTGVTDAGSDALACTGEGTACAGGLCTRGVCIPPVTINSTTNLTSTAVIPGRSCAEAPAYTVAALAADGATLSAAPDCLAVGDEALLINLQGAPGAFTNVGNWELVTVAAVTGSQVRFAAAKTKSYGAAPVSDTGVGTGATDQKVALIRVPQFGSLIVNGDLSLTAAAWDGAKGGVVVLRAASLTVRGMIDARGLGYRGGRWSRDTDACASSVDTEAGESIAGPGAPGPASNFGGAGGISASTGTSFNGNTPLQSGAGHARPGEMGSNGGARTVGAPGGTYGASNGSKLTMGSGEGGNLTCAFGFPGPALVTFDDERLAGGIVLLLTQTLEVEGGGAITASAKTAGRDVSASGGYVFIRGATVALGTGQVTAVGGTGTSVNVSGPLGSVKAGDGYIVTQATNGTGTTTPPMNRI